jgi:putative N6-adenine-specific DNA methylase
LEIDAPTFRTLEGIRQECFPDAPIHVRNADFTTFDVGTGFQAAVCNPPYGIRIGEEEEIPPLYRELGGFLKRYLVEECAGIYTVNHEAAPLFGGDYNSALPILNGSLEGRLYRFSPSWAGVGTMLP